MLKSLKIQNVALIEQAEISFGERLNVMSGETGSGKSVVLECINFVLGQKADKTMISSGKDICSVVCVFDVAGDEKVRAAMDELEIEYDDEIIIKRTLTADGRSSIKLNGESVNATMLRKVTSLLVDVHGQSDHFVLLKESNQLELLDSIGKKIIDPIKSRISDKLALIKQVNGKIANLGGSAEERARRIDYIKYCLNEIESVDFKKGEDEELVAKKKKLINSEKIVSACSESYEKLSGDGGVYDMLTEAERLTSQIASFGDEYAAISDDISLLTEQLNDVCLRLSDCLEIEFDPKELDYIEDRLDKIKTIKSKYGKDFDEITAKYGQLKAEADLLCDSDANAEKLEAEKTGLLKELYALYENLTDARKSVAEDTSVKLSAKLKELAMKNAAFSVEFSAAEDKLSPNGVDAVTFLFSANLGEPLKPLSRVISGGELSRLMLAIKTVTGSAIDRATYIFDEIDSGISGAAALTVAENFAQIAKERQIIAISHLPQIVSMADSSFVAEKFEREGKTTSVVRALSGDERVSEVLRLIGGTDSVAGLTLAKEMIDRAAVYKSRFK